MRTNTSPSTLLHFARSDIVGFGNLSHGADRMYRKTANAKIIASRLNEGAPVVDFEVSVELGRRVLRGRYRVTDDVVVATDCIAQQARMQILPGMTPGNIAVILLVEMAEKVQRAKSTTGE